MLYEKIRLHDLKEAIADIQEVKIFEPRLPLSGNKSDLSNTIFKIRRYLDSSDAEMFSPLTNWVLQSLKIEGWEGNRFEKPYGGNLFFQYVKALKHRSSEKYKNIEKERVRRNGVVYKQNPFEDDPTKEAILIDYCMRYPLLSMKELIGVLEQDSFGYFNVKTLNYMRMVVAHVLRWLNIYEGLKLTVKDPTSKEEKQ